jgi:error-prone DNA polymerase
MRYAELQAMSAFSFLRGASHAEELVATAAALGHAALGIADRNSVAGVVRAHGAARAAGLRLLVGARLVLRDGTPDVLCYPMDRAAWGRLTRLLTLGKLRASKGECALDFADLAGHAEGQLAIVLAPERVGRGFAADLARLREAFPGRLYLAATRRYRADDAARLRSLNRLAGAVGIGLVATNDVMYHIPERRELHDVMSCIRLGTTLATAGLALQPNGERHLKSPAEMARLFRAYPEAVGRSLEIVGRCNFSLDELTYDYPDEPVPPGLTPDAHLAALTWQGAARRYPDGVPATIRATIGKELALIAGQNYARYFLTVHDIVAFARSRGILCQGRGSAANSAVCFCLGITAVDPAEITLLFERFISAERSEPPDIDVDFEHERREEVIQYIYARYGRHRAGIAATVIHYRPKLAAREVGHAMGLSADAVGALAAQSWNNGGILWPDDRLAEIGLDPASPRVRHIVATARTLVGFPRHLSQHVGGFVLTRGRLDETVPIGNAAMTDRTFIEWDKDDLDTLKIMKVDVLALGMLSCIRGAFALLAARGLPIADLADIPGEDPAVYRMLSRGDSIGVFQVESRAQMNMLPRLRPATFYDLVIEVAIVRPGPIQGDMVHPYLRRRSGQEEVQFPSAELREVLGRTLGVPLFQEQAMRIAIVAAGFTPEEANRLRRAMATFRHDGTIHSFRDKMVGGMLARGYAQDFAERCFAQIEGFGTYGFPESHAASFAKLVYVSAWLKCHHPASFACALLNAQPMGFYAPAQIIQDALAHGVSVRGVDVNASLWNCTLEDAPQATLRLGLRQIGGFRPDWAITLIARRGEGWTDFAGLVAAGLPHAAMEFLAEADALRSLGLDRRQALWRVHALSDAPALPLIAGLPVAAGCDALPTMALAEHVIADYRATGLSLKAHPMRFLRDGLTADGIASCVEAGGKAEGAWVRAAGLVLVRQRPGTAGVVFATIEDETGTLNVVIWPGLQERFRHEIVSATCLVITGNIQRSPEGVVHLIAQTLEDRTAALRGMDSEERLERCPRLPTALAHSRDFH